MELELKEQQLSLVKKYPLETLVIFMLTAILFMAAWMYKLSNKVDAINSQMNVYLLTDHKEMIQVIEKNTMALEKINSR